MREAEEIRLTVPWGHIAAKAWGNPTDFPFLCVHGILDNAGAFDRLITYLPNNYYYISIDLPGHGFSSHFSPGVPLNFFDFILTIRYIVEEFKWKTFYFIGHSLGGQIGTLYSIIYPGQILKLILIEGVVPRVISNDKIIDQIRKTHDTVIEIQNKGKERLYTREEIMHALRFKRAVCLNSDAAEAIFKRSVTEVAGMFKYNRDYRLKSWIIPIFNIEQMACILTNLNVKILLFVTKSTLESFDEHIKLITDFITNIPNSTTIILDGNHDVHNNYPERIAFDICKFLKNHDISSKL